MNLSKYLLIGAASLLSLSALAPTASAATVDTKATVSFTTDAGGDGNSSLLTLDTAPQIDFGNIPLSLEAKTYNANKSLPSLLKVTDKRGGGGIGWNVTAKASSFLLEGTESTTIQGAKIIFQPGAVSPFEGHGFASPEAFGFTLDTDTPTSVNVVAAEKGEGLDTWHIDWTSTAETNPNIVLSIPAGAASVGKFTSTITWTLADAPI